MLSDRGTPSFRRPSHAENRAKPPGNAAEAGTAVRRATDFIPKPTAWSALLAKAPQEDTARGRILVTQGSGAVPPACATCHGAKSVAPQPFPALEGLPAEYIVKQLLDYRSGARQSSVMQPVARELSDSDITAVARYYAAQARPATAALPTDGAAASLHWSGDNARALPACADCHGASGRGGGPVLPPLTGQPKGMVAAQLNAFRSGARANDDDGVMRAFARRLTAAEIEGLDNFYATASAPQGGVSKSAQ
jgi:cytochrome c553